MSQATKKDNNTIMNKAVDQKVAHHSTTVTNSKHREILGLFTLIPKGPAAMFRQQAL